MSKYAKRHHRVAAKERELEKDFLEKNEQDFSILAIWGIVVYIIAIFMGMGLGYLMGREK